MFSAIEIFLRSIPASYPYLETISKPCLATTGLLSLKQGDVFSRQPIRRPTICLNTNAAFLWSKQLSTFHFRTVNLEQICIYQKRIPVPDNPINTTDEKRLYFKTMSGLAYFDNGHGINLSENTSHFFMVYDRNSTHQAWHDFFHPELTNYSISIAKKFSAVLSSNREIFIICKKASSILIDYARKVLKYHILTKWWMRTKLTVCFRYVKV